MSWIFRLGFVAVMLMLLPGRAQGQQGHTSVRNDSDVTVSCRTSREGSSRAERVTLRPGGIWRAGGESRRGWRIACDRPVLDRRFPLESGRAYHIVPHSRVVVLVVRPL